MPGVEGMAGDATRTGYGRNSPAQGRHRITFTSRRQIRPHPLGCRRDGDESVSVAPGVVVRKVGRIGPLHTETVAEAKGIFDALAALLSHAMICGYPAELVDDID